MPELTIRHVEHKSIIDLCPLGIAWLPALECADLVHLVGAVLASSVGPEDQLAVETLGADGAAERILSLKSSTSP